MAKGKRIKQINNLTIHATLRGGKMPTTVYTVWTPDDRALEEFSGTQEGITAQERAERYCRTTTDFVRA